MTFMAYPTGFVETVTGSRSGIMSAVTATRPVATISLFFATLLWGSSFIGMKMALGGYDPIVVVFGRMLVGSLLFMLLIRRFRRLRYQKGDWKLLLVMSLCEPCLYFIFEAYALQYTSASQAGMIVALLPVMVAVAARFYLGERISAKGSAGFVLAMVGAIWLSATGVATESSPNPLLGNFLEFLAMITAVGYIITAKKLTARYPADFITAMQAFVGAVFFFPLLFLPTTHLPTEFPLAPSLAVLYLGAVVTVGAYGMYNFGISRVPANQSSVFINLIPIYSVVFGHLILGESLVWQQYAASVVVLAGVWMAQMNSRTRKAIVNPESF